MNERQPNTQKIPLFDEIPQDLKGVEDKIKKSFDGTFGVLGITMVLNPATGEVIKAHLTDLLTGKVTGYEPLSRGKWTSPVGDLREESALYQKLDSVYEDVYKKYEAWKYDPYRQNTPIREWISAKISGDSGIVSPENWYRKEINPNPEDPIREAKDGVVVYRKPVRRKTGPVQRIHPAIIASQDSPRLKDRKPAPTSFRRAADKSLKRELSRRSGR